MYKKPRIVTVTLNPAVDRTLSVDRLVPGEHIVAREVSRTPGGKGVNVSRVLAGLNAPSVATGFLGKENRREFAPIFAAGLVRDAFITVPGATRVNTTIVSQSDGTDTHLREPGLSVPVGAITRLERAIGSLAGPGTIVIFSGSLPDDFQQAQFARLLDLCTAAGARLAVDTSGPTLAYATQRPLWLVKPNVAELETLAGRKLPSLKSQLSAARKLTNQIEMVLLSRGRRGAALVTQRKQLVAVAPALPAGALQSTVGCGDVLLATFVAGLVRGASRPQSLRHAVAAASASATSSVPCVVNERLAARFARQIDSICPDW